MLSGLLSKKPSSSARWKSKDGFLSIALPAFAGLVVFLIVYGWSPINPGNDRWIMAGYDETDIIQHYSGWLAFRNSAWRFPLGLAEDMAVGDGVIISFTDSIPWVAIFFKLFRRFLPETFQYFGIYTLLCYILQSVAAFKILFFKTKDKIYSSLGMIFFSFAPILMERAFRHTALGSQWLILFSILVYLKHKEKPERGTYVSYLLLGCLAIGLHPYFLPMVFCFSFLCTCQDVYGGKWWSAGVLLGQLVVTAFAGWCIGALGSGVEMSRFGFGYFSMNLNAVINPVSRGDYDWSSLMKTHSQILGNYDGFNYVGAGMLALIVVVAVLIIVSDQWKSILASARREFLLLSVLVLLTAFALSNVVTYNGRVLFTYPLPEFILGLCGIFRASSRMFYPVYYMLFLFLLLQMLRCVGGLISRRKCMLLLLSALFIQLFDIRYAILEKHQMMEKNVVYTSILQDETLKEVAVDSEGLILVNFTGDDRRTAVWAHKNGMKTYYSTGNSGQFFRCSQLREEVLANIHTLGDMGDMVIASSDMAVVLEYLNELTSSTAYEYNGVYYIYKDRESIDGKSHKAVYLGDTLLDRSKQNIILPDITNEEWEKGVYGDGSMLLMRFSQELSDALEQAGCIVCGEDVFYIESVEHVDIWLEVRVDREAYGCRYPAVLQLN